MFPTVKHRGSDNHNFSRTVNPVNSLLMPEKYKAWVDEFRFWYIKAVS